ncbi:MAG: allophanate hydrolase, partial [Pseudomonadota bacterium]
IAALLYDGAWVAERHAAVEAFLAKAPDEMHPVTAHVIGKAAHLSATDAFRDIYRLAELRRRVEPVLAHNDALCVPTIPGVASLAAVEGDPIGANTHLGTYTNFVNLLDLCGIAVPTGPGAHDKQGSVTVLCPAGEDGRAAAIAGMLEQSGTLGATAWPRTPSLPASPSDAPDALAIAVCGAHMSGMALNGELTSRGGRFIRAARTAHDYSLYALPGGPPHRPGLVRAQNGAGGAIEVEVWALPLAEVGGFLAGIPAPLGIGTVDLEDGTSAKGFLCEAAAVAQARDVTAFGSWRKVVAQA